MANDATGTPLALGDTVAIPGKVTEVQEVTDDGGNNLRVETLYKTPGGSVHTFAVSSAQVEKISDVPGSMMKDVVEPPIVEPPDPVHPSHPIHRPDRPSGPDKPELPDKPVGPGKPERPDVKPEPVNKRR